MRPEKLRLGLPKGSLLEHTLAIFKTAGFDIAFENERSYKPKIDDVEIEPLLLRPQEIPAYVAEGKLDAGISGDDWIAESGAKVIKIADLRYSKKNIGPVKWVLAVPENSKIKSVKDLNGKKISTELVRVVKTYLKKHKVKAEVEFSWGATEIKTPLFADAVVDLTETGSSIKANGLKVIDVVMGSSTRLIAGEETLKNRLKKEKLSRLVMLLLGAVHGEEAVMLMLHVPEAKLRLILELTKTIKNPTVRKLAGSDYFSVIFGAEKKKIRDLLPQLKKGGCEDIVEFPLNTCVS